MIRTAVFPTEMHEAKFRECLGKVRLHAKEIPNGIAVRPRVVGSFRDIVPNRDAFAYVLAQHGLGNCAVTDRALRTLKRHPDIYIEFRWDD